MVARPNQSSNSLEAYFQHEDSADTKSEYFDGVIIAMAGASAAHVEITFNLSVEIGSQLRGQPCRGFGSDLRVYVETCNAVFYPDLTVACGTPQFAQVRLATLLDPTAIIEVLSPSTERVDRGTKFDCYRTVESLSTYLLVSQEEPRIESYTRHADGFWRYDVAKGLDATLRIDSIDCILQLSNIYARVGFPLAPVESNTASQAAETTDAADH